MRTDYYLIGSMDFLDNETKEGLIDCARQFEYYKDFEDAVGWQEWMSDFCESDELNEEDEKRINKVLKEIWENK